MSEKQPEDGTTRAAAIAAELPVVIGKLKRRWREQAGSGDMPQAWVTVLSHLDKQGPATVTTIAQALGVRSQSMGATVRALQAAGHIEGSPDPNDGRQTLLSLTPACKAWIADGRAARQDWLFRALQAKLTPLEQEQILVAIGVLDRLVSS